ncbi:hypothetical protein Pelo_10770 [Pelomyxa schiedti]|nr:hypothetical protein Pelo_10770 [Pelomyxa schiedti]
MSSGDPRPEKQAFPQTAASVPSSFYGRYCDPRGTRYPPVTVFLDRPTTICPPPPITLPGFNDALRFLDPVPPSTNAGHTQNQHNHESCFSAPHQPEIICPAITACATESRNEIGMEPETVTVIVTGTGTETETETKAPVETSTNTEPEQSRLCDDVSAVEVGSSRIAGNVAGFGDCGTGDCSIPMAPNIVVRPGHARTRWIYGHHKDDDDSVPTYPIKNCRTSHEKSCICERPFHQYDWMIECDKCDKWFHGYCMNVEKGYLDRPGFKTSFICPECSSVKRSEIRYTFECIELKKTFAPHLEIGYFLVPDSIDQSPSFLDSAVCDCGGRDDGNELVVCYGCKQWFHPHCVSCAALDALLSGDSARHSEKSLAFCCSRCSLTSQSELCHARDITSRKSSSSRNVVVKACLSNKVTPESDSSGSLPCLPLRPVSVVNALFSQQFTGKRARMTTCRVSKTLRWDNFTPYAFYDMSRILCPDANEVPRAVRFRPQSRILAIGTNAGTIVLTNVQECPRPNLTCDPHCILTPETPECQSIRGFSPEIGCLEWTSDKMGLICSSLRDSTVQIIDPSASLVTGFYSGHSAFVRMVHTHALHPFCVLSSSFDKSIHCWDFRTRAVHSPSSVSVWDSDGSHSSQCAFKCIGHKGGVVGAHFVNGNEIYIVSASTDATVRLWDSRNTSEHISLIDLGSKVLSFDQSVDGSQIALDSLPGQVTVLEMETLLHSKSNTVFPIATLRGHMNSKWGMGHVVYSNDGSLAVSSECGGAYMWDIPSMKHSICRMHTSWVWDVGWSDYGDLATCSEDRAVVVSNYSGTTKGESKRGVGSHVLARWGDGKYYHAKVRAENKDRTSRITFPLWTGPDSEAQYVSYMLYREETMPCFKRRSCLKGHSLVQVEPYLQASFFQPRERLKSATLEIPASDDTCHQSPVPFNEPPSQRRCYQRPTAESTTPVNKCSRYNTRNNPTPANHHTARKIKSAPHLKKYLLRNCRKRRLNTSLSALSDTSSPAPYESPPSPLSHSLPSILLSPVSPSTTSSTLSYSFPCPILDSPQSSLNSSTDEWESRRRSLSPHYRTARHRTLPHTTDQQQASEFYLPPLQIPEDTEIDPRDQNGPTPQNPDPPTSPATVTYNTTTPTANTNNSNEFQASEEYLSPSPPHNTDSSAGGADYDDDFADVNVDSSTDDTEAHSNSTTTTTITITLTQQPQQEQHQFAEPEPPPLSPNGASRSPSPSLPQSRSPLPLPSPSPSPPQPSDSEVDVHVELLPVTAGIPKHQPHRRKVPVHQEQQMNGTRVHTSPSNGTPKENLPSPTAKTRKHYNLRRKSHRT